MINTQGLRLVADLLKENRPVLAGIHVFEDDNMKHTECQKISPSNRDQAIFVSKVISDV